MARENNPQFGTLDEPFIQDILTGRNALTSTQASSFGSMACLLTLTPSKFDQEPLYNARYMEEFSRMLHPSAFIEADAVRQMTEEPKLRDIAVEETVNYISKVAQKSINFENEECLYRTDLHHAYINNATAERAGIYKLGGYYPLILCNREGRTTNGIMGRQLLTIPGGLKTTEIIGRELTGFEKELFDSMLKHYPHELDQFTYFNDLSPQKPLDFMPSHHPSIRDLRQMHRISADSQRVLGQSACFLGLAVQPAPTIRFSVRYMHQALKATRPKGRSIRAMQELACETSMQELMAEEIDRYLENVAVHAEPYLSGQLDIRIKDLPVLGRTRASTCNTSERDSYRMLFRQYGHGKPTGIMSEQTLIVPGNSRTITMLEGYYSGIKAKLLSAMNIIYGLADQV